jgi:UDP-N-acetylmuramate: L-alanyl-gamma-D-glutamyl-meso-diaminopimelate ligase
VNKLGVKFSSTKETVAYQTPEYDVIETGTLLYFNGEKYPLKIFGSHNLQNLMGAMRIGQKIGIEPEDFFKAIQSFTGAGKRLQKVAEKGTFTMFKDFAHSPSKLKATTKAVKEQFVKRHVVACMELHTFSSLKKEFLPHYENAMQAADEAIVYFSHDVVAHKKLDPITKELVAAGFGGGVTVLNETQEILDFIHSKNWNNSVLLMMSSGNFDGINYEVLGDELSSQLE